MSESINVQVTMAPARKSVLVGFVWMLVISILLFWLPVFGPFIAGVVGGKKAGSLGRALFAVLLPSLLFGALLFVIASSLTGLPLIGAIAGIGGVVLSLLHVGPLLVGAIIGGFIA